MKLSKHKILNFFIMDVSNWIALGVFAITVFAFVVSFSKYKGEIKKQMTDEYVQFQNKVNENSVKINRIEIDIVKLRRDFEKENMDMRRKHEKDLEGIKFEISSQIKEFIHQNREDHQLIFNELKTSTKEITEAATLIKAHIKEDSKT